MKLNFTILSLTYTNDFKMQAAMLGFNVRCNTASNKKHIVAISKNSSPLEDSDLQKLRDMGYVFDVIAKTNAETVAKNANLLD